MIEIKELIQKLAEEIAVTFRTLCYPEAECLYDIDENIVDELLTAAIEHEHWRDCINEFFMQFDEKIKMYGLVKCFPDDKIEKYCAWNDYKFNDMEEKIQEIYLMKHPKKRSDEDTARVYTERLAHLIFGDCIQDNGDKETLHSFKMNMLGSLVKESLLEKVTPEQIERFKEIVNRNCYVFQKVSCDYGPDRVLHNLLTLAGIQEDIISDICPWKTMLMIDPVDNSIIERHYNEKCYL